MSAGVSGHSENICWAQIRNGTNPSSISPTVQKDKRPFELACRQEYVIEDIN